MKIKRGFRSCTWRARAGSCRLRGESTQHMRRARLYAVASFPDLEAHGLDGWFDGFSNINQWVLQFSDTNWVSYNSIQYRCHPPGERIRLPRLKGSVPLECSQVCSPHITHTSDKPGYKVEASIIPRFDNSLERLTELRKAFNLHSLIYYRGCNSRTAKWKQGTGQAMEEGM